MRRYVTKDKDYVSKNINIELEDWERQNHKKRMYDGIVDGSMKIHELVSESPWLLPQFETLTRNLAAYKNEKQRLVQRPHAKLILLTGDAGGGKTSMVYSFAEMKGYAVYAVPEFSHDIVRAPGYTNQEVLLFDNVAYGHVPPYDWLLKLTDPHPRMTAQADVKYGMPVHLQPLYVFMTSTVGPEEFYLANKGKSNEYGRFNDEMKRRIHAWKHVTGGVWTDVPLTQFSVSSFDKDVFENEVLSLVNKE